MAHVINDNCVMCGTCADVCPIGCISEGDGKYVIDADQCVDCGTCVGAFRSAGTAEIGRASCRERV